ncbi:hypothetical protein [Nocardia abscessus]|uniref:hypothetical protein n=1 Tax=Nocardia abscessus TaxID=120957 RepID=UPI00245487CF|nr:hypothetical protein [Nocardia abscessus]
MKQMTKGHVDPAVKQIEAFVLRARRVIGHSLMVEHRELMQHLHEGKVNITVTLNQKTGEATNMVRQAFPPEEIMESLAARIRPLILKSERVYFGKVLDAIESLVPDEELGKIVEPISWWRERWESMTDRSNTAEAQAFLIATAKGTVTDRQLMYAWLYSDLVHADDVEEATLGLSLAQRYRAAAGVLSRIAEVTERTLGLVEALVEAGLLKLDRAVFETPVVVAHPNLEEPSKVYTASGPDVPLPTDASAELDPELWTPLHVALPPPAPAEGLLAAPTDAD